MEIASKDLIGLPVFSLEEGEKLGQVKDLVLDPGKRAIIAITVGTKKMFQEEKIVPFHKIHHIGPEALLLSSTAHLEKKTNLPQMMKLINRPLHICGNRVMSEDGTTLGKVREYYADMNTGALTNLEMGNNFLDGFLKGKAFLSAEQIVVFGADVIIVRDEEVPETNSKNYGNTMKLGMNKAFSSIKGKSKNIKINFQKKDAAEEKSIIFPSVGLDEIIIEEEIKTVPATEPELPAAKTEIFYQKAKPDSIE